ncbi:MAG TPA: winged helix-turn-helix domain-containing protein [Nitrososphaera sp.]|nr:winged helix-turn-helix domain-containing protein [Nitrososphaera sp.]HEX2015009.1 winged helix-turn-helix domain-containing protein [Nitrososphaera sp.]
MAAGYRTHVSIIADILFTARQYSYEGYDNGATVTHLIRKANVPHQRLSSMVLLLTQSGLLYEDSAKYKISDKGILFLKAYTEFKDFAETFGLKV